MAEQNSSYHICVRARNAHLNIVIQSTGRANVVFKSQSKKFFQTSQRIAHWISILAVRVAQNLLYLMGR